MDKIFHQFQRNVTKEIEMLCKSVPTLWVVEAQYYVSYSPTRLSYHLSKDDAEAKKPKDYYVFYGSGEDSATYTVKHVETKAVPIEILMRLFAQQNMCQIN